jgi:hypothetical protein
MESDPKELHSTSLFLPPFAKLLFIARFFSFYNTKQAAQAQAKQCKAKAANVTQH